jgi:hypothetical protein
MQIDQKPMFCICSCCGDFSVHTQENSFRIAVEKYGYIACRIFQVNWRLHFLGQDLCCKYFIDPPN